ncbi:MAG TPA: DUF4166 domain-containing protein [Candidatus Elarobacter sp.]|nr:DUF4166 domain-containing protein [Candidatus Elarobacter sp.]
MQLYERLLGSSFARLPAVLRRFHGQPGGRADFALEVTHEPGFLRNAVARALRMPAAAARAPGTLVVSVRGDREIWVRTFPDLTLRTTQWLDAGRLVEQAGPLQFVFDVDADERGMRFSQTVCRLFGRTLPRALAPRVETVVRGDERDWNVLVSIDAPVLGRIVTYGGPVIPQP